jgi:hypothetical protein
LSAVAWANGGISDERIAARALLSEILLDDDAWPRPASLKLPLHGDGDRDRKRNWQETARWRRRWRKLDKGDRLRR